jgi:hypothetical protein
MYCPCSFHPLAKPADAAELPLSRNDHTHSTTAPGSLYTRQAGARTWVSFLPRSGDGRRVLAPSVGQEVDRGAVAIGIAFS